MNSYLKDSLEEREFAFLIGNGINRFCDKQNQNKYAWGNILSELFGKTYPKKGISPIEYYDINASINEKEIKEKLADIVGNWEKTDIHEEFLSAFKNFNRPVLTTNIDRLFDETERHTEKVIGTKRFSARYPFNLYYSDKTIHDVCNQFAIWHINGTINRKQSIKFGMTDYLLYFKRTNEIIHEVGEHLQNNTTTYWHYQNTWVNPFFNLPLVIIGLGLNEEEIFLRWLFIQREKLYKRYGINPMQSFYLYAERDSLSKGKCHFLKSLHITPIRYKTYASIYKDIFDI